MRQFDRRLNWEACFNARDLGGYPVRDGRHTLWRRVVRADNLRRLTAKGVTAVVADGVRTIIDLRAPFEVRMDPCPFAPPDAAAGGPTYFNLPVLDPDDQDLNEAVDVCESVAEMYALLLDRCVRQIAAIVAALGAARDGGVLVYCHAGKDRTGLIAALLLALAGVPHDTIAEDYALSDRYLQPLYRAQLRQERDAAKRLDLEQRLRSPLNAAAPATMLATLAYLDERHGGVAAYLRSAGVAPHELELIRTRLGGRPAQAAASGSRPS